MTQPTDPNLAAAATQLFNGEPIPPLPPLPNPQSANPPIPPPRQSATPPTAVNPPKPASNPVSPVQPTPKSNSPMASSNIKNDIRSKLEEIAIALLIVVIPQAATVFMCVKEILSWVDALMWGLFGSIGLLIYCIWNQATVKPIFWIATWTLSAGPTLAYLHWNGQFLPKVG